MIQLKMDGKSFPIFANFSDPLNEERLEWEFWQKGDKKMTEWLEKTGRRLLEARPGPVTVQSTKYENDVIAVVKTIYRNRMGNLLLNALNGAVNIFIVPFHGDEREKCGCAALTPWGVYPKKWGGGIRLYFDPADFAGNTDSYTADDILFHELVHAYRIGKKNSEQKNRPLDGYRSAEEFVAVQMQNVYLDCRGLRRYYLTHLNPVMRTKSHIYGEIRDSSEYLQALNYFISREPLAQEVSRWRLPSPDYNPWRDFPGLLRMFQDKYELPNLTFMPL